MAGPDIDIEKPNPLGGLDRLATDVGLAVIAVFPTLIATVFAPWTLGPLLTEDKPDGRKGMILSPGVYLVLSMVVILMMVGSLISSDAAQIDGGLIGPRLAAEVSAAVSDGDVWLTLSKITPVFVTALVFGVTGRALTRWAGDWWDIRVSLRASFYAISTAVCWMVLISLAVDVATRMSLNISPAQGPPSFMGFFIIGSIYWVYFWCFRSGGNLSLKHSAFLTIAMFVLTAMVIIFAGAVLFTDGVFGEGG